MALTLNTYSRSFEVARVLYGSTNQSNFSHQPVRRRAEDHSNAIQGDAFMYYKSITMTRRAASKLKEKSQ